MIAMLLKPGKFPIMVKSNRLSSTARSPEKRLRELMRQFGAELAGAGVFDKYGDYFPLLLKFLDCDKRLPAHMHPNDFHAARLQLNDKGKTEAWYIIKADEDAAARPALAVECAYYENGTQETTREITIDLISEPGVYDLDPDKRTFFRACQYFILERWNIRKTHTGRDGTGKFNTGTVLASAVTIAGNGEDVTAHKGESLPIPRIESRNKTRLELQWRRS
jgi:mannose-6-phosphate isomerase class I